MFSFLKRRAFLIVLGFLLIAVCIWFAGPYFAFAEYRPLESETARLVTIVLVIALGIIWILIRRLRARQASDKLVAAVVTQSQAGEPAPSGDVVKLREGFEEAVASLKQQRSGHGLYDLPWYVFIGAPGSGKTTALLNSGLKFSLQQGGVKAKLRGVGGTRNCDWLFTDEAVFLDTAGRFTTQDSDATSDSAAWKEFLALLCKYRKRRPVNGVILVISAKDLMTQGDAAREAQVESARLRLRELTRELRIQLPVYVMVTMCDLVAGFTEYFDDLEQDGRAQVWGVTFPYEQTVKGEATRAFPAEFEALITRLNARLFARLEEERDVRRRAKAFAFPQQIAALRDALVQFVSEVFASTRADKEVLLRGVYFTSGTQEGTPIDRLLGSIGRAFGVAPDAVAAPLGRGKAYFVERLLKEVLIGESGLAGINRRFEMKKAAAELGAYVALMLIAALGVIVFYVSYSRNRDYLAEMEAEVAKLSAVPAVQSASSVETLLPRLDAVRAVVDAANRYNGDTPWSMRWGLYQGRSVGNSARDAYARELDSVLLPFVAARMKQRVDEYAGAPDKLYDYLKAYVMLGQPQHLDKKYLQTMANFEWTRARGVSPDAGASLSKHFQSLLDREDMLRPIALEPQLVARACGTLRQAKPSRIMYTWLKDTYAADPRQVRLDLSLGVAGDQVFRRRSGVRLTEPIPSVYGQAVFKEITRRDLHDLAKRFIAERWVCSDALSSTDTVALENEVVSVYETDYTAAWDAILNDIELVPLASVPQATRTLELLSGAGSPLRGLLQVVVDNTSLPPAPQTPEAPGVVSSATKAVTDRLDRLGRLLAPLDANKTPAAVPGASITAHFQSIHRLLEGAAGAAPIDQVLARIGELQQQLRAIGKDLAGRNIIEVLSDPRLRDTRLVLRQESARLPQPIDKLISQLGQNTEDTLGRGATNTLVTFYQAQVVTPCRTVISDRYPFTPSSSRDVPIPEFGRVFGYGGVFDTFFVNNLEKLVDTSQGRWTWLPDSVRLSDSMLRQFEAARELRDTFFSQGTQRPDLQFTVTLPDLDATALQFTLQIDGQSFQRGRDARPAMQARWPGQNPGPAAATFDERTGIPSGPSLEGPWAWFRLIDAGRPQRESETRTVLTFQGRSHQARVTIESSSLRNPFANRQWQRFSCGS